MNKPKTTASQIKPKAITQGPRRVSLEREPKYGTWRVLVYDYGKHNSKRSKHGILTYTKAESVMLSRLTDLEG